MNILQIVPSISEESDGVANFSRFQIPSASQAPCVRLVVVSNFLSILGGRSGMSNETIPRRTQAGAGGNLCVTGASKKDACDLGRGEYKKD